MIFLKVCFNLIYINSIVSNILLQQLFHLFVLSPRVEFLPVCLYKSIQDFVGVGENAIGEKEYVGVVGTGRTGQEVSEQGRDWKAFWLRSGRKKTLDNYVHV